MAAETVSLAYHNFSLPPYGAAHWGSGVDALRKHGEDAPWSDYETIFNEQLMDAAETNPEEVRQTVGSIHTPFWTPDGMTGLVVKYHRILSSDRTERMVETAHHIDPKMPVVVYPRTLAPEAASFAAGHKLLLLAQTEPALYSKDAAGSNDPDVILPWLEARAIRGFCPDTVHAREALSTIEAEAAWTKMAQSGKAYQAHVSANRWDSSLGKQSREEFKAMLKSPEAALQTQMGQMIVELVQQWQKPEDAPDANLRLVLEFAPGRPLLVRRQHIRFARNLIDLVEQYGGVPVKTPEANSRLA